MSDENAEIIRRLVETYNEGGFGSAATLDFLSIWRRFLRSLRSSPVQPWPRDATP